MRAFQTTFEIKATPERVWEVLSDVERWPEWTSTMTSVERRDREPFVVGAKARVRQPKLLPAVWEVTELQPGRSFTWISRSPGIRVTARHEVAPVASGSRVTLSLEFAGFLGPLVAFFTRRLNESYLATETQGLTRRCETP